MIRTAVFALFGFILCGSLSAQDSPGRNVIQYLQIIDQTKQKKGIEDRQKLFKAADELDQAGGNYEAAHNAFLSLLADPSVSDEMRIAVLEKLSHSGDARCVRIILDSVGTASAAVQTAAADSLKKMKGREIVRELLTARKGATSIPLDLQLIVSDRPDSASLGLNPEPFTRDLAEPSEPCLVFEKRKLTSRTFEAASTFDVNNDGTTDIVCGGFWYEGPEFVAETKVCDVKPSGEYFDDFSDYPMDVNGDGCCDFITGGFFGGPLRWRENPCKGAGDWKEIPIENVGSIETTRFWDVDRDGFPEACPNASGRIDVFRLVRDSAGKGTGKFEKHQLRKAGIGHGLGFGDINGDGRGDFIGPNAWYEAPEKPFESGEWKEHKQFDLGAASVPIIVHDVNSDGRNDIVVGHGHDYGLFWLEQERETLQTGTWKTHMVEPDRSQYHEMMLKDITGDGKPELVTGKRYRAHNDNDPGAHEPIGVYYFEFIGGRLHRRVIDYGPPDRTAGTGIYMWIDDVNGDGTQDIVCPGKQGLYLLLNRGFAGSGRP